MKFFLFISTFFSIVLLTMHIALLPLAEVCPSGVAQKYEHLEPQKVVAAYFLSWHGKETYTLKDFDKGAASKITHLLYAFAEPKKNGEVELLYPKFAFGVGYNYQVPKGHFEQLLDIKKKYPHLKVLLSIGGGGCNQIFLKLYEDGLLKKVAKSFVEMLDKYVYTYRPEKDVDKKTVRFNYSNLFDGIDINWEFSPRGVKDEHAKAYLSFVKEIKRLLDRRAKKLRRRMVLTATLQISPAIYRSLPLSEIAKQVNWFHVMGYDIFGLFSHTAGHNSQICGQHGIYTIDGALNRIIDQGVSPNKLVLGISGYGHKYGENNGHGKSFNKKSKETKSLFYKDIHKYFVDNEHYERSWNDRELVPSLFNKKNKTFISYDDPESVKIKTQFAAEKRLAGVMLWALSYDNENHDLVNALSENVGKRMFE